MLAGPAAPGLGWRPAAPGRLVITGLLTARTCATLDPDAAVLPLLPHDAARALEGSGADIMIIDAAAALPGGPWSYIGDPAAADRDRRLADLTGLARSLGIPVVFLRTLPAGRAPGLEALAARCDVVSDGDLGVQLARFNPIHLDPGRPCDAIYAGRRDPREPPAQRRMLDALEHAGVRAAPELTWQAAPGFYRRHGLFVASSARQAREQLACGARVIGPVGAAAEPVAAAIHLPGTATAAVAPAAAAAAAAAGATTATEAATAIAGPAIAGPAAAADGTAAAALAAAREQGAMAPGEIQAVLRDLFTRHATPVRLAELAAHAGVAADPLAARRVAVLATVTSGEGGRADAARLASAVLRQRHRPAEVILAMPRNGPGRARPAAPQASPAPAAPAGILAALREVTDMGVAVRMAREPGLAGAARAARCEWVVPWDTARGYPDTYLLDLVCARELSRADVVGMAGPAGSMGAYTFVHELEPALAARELLNSGEFTRSASAGWARSGYRLLAISLQTALPGGDDPPGPRQVAEDRSRSI